MMMMMMMMISHYRFILIQNNQSSICSVIEETSILTRSSADADNGLDAFSDQSRSTNIVPFHMLHIVSYCAIVILSLRHAFL